MANKKGSMLWEFSQVTNIESITTKSLRRSLEPHVQGNEKMLTRSKAISQHSAKVGQKFYDRSGEDFRGAAMFYITGQEGVNKRSLNEIEEGKDVEKRAKLAEDDRKAKVEKAKEVLKRNVNRNMQLGKTCKVLPVDRLFLQESFAVDGKFAYVLEDFEKFPGR